MYSAPSSYNMVHPCLIKLGTFSNLRMKERGRKRGKERGSHRVGYTASLYPVRNAFHDTWLEHHKLITPAFSKLLFSKYTVYSTSFSSFYKPFWGQTATLKCHWAWGCSKQLQHDWLTCPSDSSQASCLLFFGNVLSLGSLGSYLCQWH